MNAGTISSGPVTVCADASGEGSPRMSLTLLGSGEGRSSNWGRGRGRDQSHFLISFGLSFVSRVKNKVGGSGTGARQDPHRTTSESIRPLPCFISPPLGPYCLVIAGLAVQVSPPGTDSLFGPKETPTGLIPDAMPLLRLFPCLEYSVPSFHFPSRSFYIWIHSFHAASWSTCCVLGTLLGTVYTVTNQASKNPCRAQDSLAERELR